MPPVGKSGPLTNLSRRAVLDIGIFDQRHQRAAKLAQIVRRDAGRHADGDAGGAIGQKIGKGGGQHHRLFVLAVIGGAEIHRIFVQAVEQRLRRFRQTAFGVAHGGGVIAIDIAEIALALDQGITQGEILGQAHQRLVNREVAMGMIFADDVAHDAGAFLETGSGIEAQQPHGMHQPAMHRLEPVAHIRQGALGDGGKGIGEIALGQRLGQRLGTDVVGFDGSAHGPLLFRFRVLARTSESRLQPRGAACRGPGARRHVRPGNGR